MALPHFGQFGVVASWVSEDGGSVVNIDSVVCDAQGVLSTNQSRLSVRLKHVAPVPDHADYVAAADPFGALRRSTVFSLNEFV